MIVVDANVLLYAYNADSAHHDACRGWLGGALNGAEQIGLPWQSLLAFIRISTNARAFARPLQAAVACSIVEEWLGRPQVTVAVPGEGFWKHFVAQMKSVRAAGALVTDTALAALVLEAGAALCTTDRDFRRFEGLRILDPTN